MRQKSFFALFALIFLLVVRASLLESTDLVDPTESRYGSVAQQMVMSGDWITPRLPMAGGITPYLGKPPLHFWLTAISYEIFSMDEWSTRLPSFLCAVGCLALMWLFTTKIFRATSEQAAFSILIVLASPIFFLLSGASAVDMTLTFCITLSLTTIAFAVQAFDKNNRAHFIRYCLICAIGAALGVLTKGPVALVLIGFPIIAWLAITSRLRLLRSVPWISMTVLFLLVVVPWFVLCERDNPGFLKYFLFSENIGRYLVRNYGDRYGTGHTHVRGFVWVMLLISFLPWSLISVAWLFFGNIRHELKMRLRTDAWLLYSLLWGLAPAMFFTFVRQLHMAYVLPGLPGLGLFFAASLRTLVAQKTEQWLRPTRFLVPLFFVGLLGFAVVVGAPTPHVMLSCALLLSGLAIAIVVSRANLSVGIAHASFVGALFLSTIPVSAHFINERKSTEIILKQVLHDTDTFDPVVGVAAGNTYSQYWLANVGVQELGEPLRVVYVNLRDSEKPLPNDVLVKQEDVARIPEGRLADYTERSRTKKWVWFHRSSPVV